MMNRGILGCWNDALTELSALSTFGYPLHFSTHTVLTREARHLVKILESFLPWRGSSSWMMRWALGVGPPPPPPSCRGWPAGDEVGEAGRYVLLAIKPEI